jgi:beta-lactamase class A
MKQKVLIVLSVLFFVTTIVMGGLYFNSRDNSDKETGMYPLLAKRIFLENPSDVLINFQPLRSKIKEYLDNTGVPNSFYFEYLFTGSTIRHGESNAFVGASLMKIPIVMDLYKVAEQGKVNLDQEVTVRTTDINKDPQFGNKRNLKAGDVITLREAAKISLVESDNTASLLVFNTTQGLLKPEEQAINNLDVETTIRDSSQGKIALVSSREYSSFLKCLYFSCFLTPEHSQEILNEITNTDNTGKDRIRAGVPKDITVAQKIGSFSNVTQSDCGIVYVPDRRYIACIMLDEDGEPANKHIREISEIIYDYVSSQ